MLRYLRILSSGVVLATVMASAVAAAAAPSAVPFEKNAVVTGRLSADPACVSAENRRNPQVWLSVGQILLYQVEVPVNGTFEFHVVPGKYELVANNPQGCLVQLPIEVGATQVAQAELKLAPVSQAHSKTNRGDRK